MNPEGARASLFSTLGVALLGVLIIGVVLGARHVLQRPRLAVSLSLRGSTKYGTLYAKVENRGSRIARDARVEVSWIGEAGERIVETRELGDIEAHGGILAPFRNLHQPIDGQEEGWSKLLVVARAKNAAAARAELALDARSMGSAEPPVTYARLDRCEESPAGEHAMQTSRVLNDGVFETWEVCGRCRAVRRLPLSPADEARQRFVRQERAAKLQKDLEEEMARATREERESPRWTRRAVHPDDETFPLEVAFMVLDLDPARATWEDVQRAHRRLALLHHPDRARGSSTEVAVEAENRMQDINRARDRLREHFGAA